MLSVLGWIVLIVAALWLLRALAFLIELAEGSTLARARLRGQSPRIRATRKL